MSLGGFAPTSDIVFTMMEATHWHSILNTTASQMAPNINTVSIRNHYG